VPLDRTFQAAVNMCPKLTNANLFIIESLSLRDERKDRFEGRFLSQILHLGGKEAIYYYFRTKKEMLSLLELFGESRYRYLHLSCHGVKDEDGITRRLGTTLDDISFDQVARMVRPYLREKRLFISACSVVNEILAEKTIPPSGCSSIIGPAKDIVFSDAAIVWASFYHLMFKEDPSRMVRKDITETLRKVAKTFRIPLNYFSIKGEREFKGDLITAKGDVVRIYPKP